MPRTRWNRSSSRMRCWSSRSLRTCSISAFSIDSARVSFSTPSRVNTRTSMTVPSMPGGTRSDVSFTSRRLLAEDRAQQLLFRRQLGLALRRDLADQDVAGLHFGADEGDARLVELGERRVADVRDVRGDFLGPELGVARDAGQLLDVDRGEAVFLHHALGDQDRVLEVVAVPRHERDQQVLARARARRGAVDGPSASTSPRAIVSPAFTSGRWLMQVFWFERVYFVRL